MTTDDALEICTVLGPTTWKNDEGPEGWLAVANNEDIIAYIRNENDAFGFRIAEINRMLNG